MMKKILVLMVGFLLIGVSLYAGSGDLIVNGKLGVGTTSPGAKLHLLHTSPNDDATRILVDGQTTANTVPLIGLHIDNGKHGANSVIKFTAENNGGTDNAAYITLDPDNQTLGLSRSGDDTSPDLAIDSSGNVGIGTTGPSRRLQVIGDVRFGGTVSLSQTAPLDVIAHSGTTIFQAWDDNDLNTPRFVVERTGNVGIGTTSPRYTLDVAGAIASENHFSVRDGANNIKGELGNGVDLLGPGINDSALVLRYRNELVISKGTSRKVIIDGNGNVGIGTMTPSPSHKLHVNGSVLCTGGCTSSSREVKQNIRELEVDEAMTALVKLRPTKFEYKYNGEEDVGFIAEDVPELVAKKGRKGLDAMDIVAVLTKVVQEQQKEIEMLKSKFEQFKTEK